MTLRNWLESNDYFQEAVIYDSGGREIGLFFGDNDPKYEAKVKFVLPRNPEYPWLAANVYIEEASW